MKVSGFGVLASLAYVTLLITQFTIYALTSMDNMVKMSQAALESLEKQNTFEVQLVNVDGRLIWVDITNEGPKDIRVKNLLASDLIVVYFDNSSRRKVKWVGYQPNASNGLGRWYIAEVLTNGFPLELFDPIVLPAGVEGLWNKGETLRAVVELDENFNTTLPVYVVFKVVG
ncbi:MAG: hypothetical protein QXD31_02260 [Candidatus Caldarchaeum sp.]